MIPWHPPVDWPWWKEKRFKIRNPIKILTIQLKKKTNDKEKRKEKNALRDIAEVDSIGPTDLLNVGW